MWTNHMLCQEHQVVNIFPQMHVLTSSYRLIYHSLYRGIFDLRSCKINAFNNNNNRTTISEPPLTPLIIFVQSISCFNYPANVLLGSHTANPLWNGISIKISTKWVEEKRLALNPALMPGLTGMESGAFHLVFISEGQSIPLPDTTHTVINNVIGTIKHAWAAIPHHTVPNDLPPLTYTMIDHSGAAVDELLSQEPEIFHSWIFSN